MRRHEFITVIGGAVVAVAILLTSAFSQVSASCQKFVGVWNISDMRTVIRENGTGIFSDGGTFTWTCAGNVWTYTVSGLMPGPWRMTLSPDGKKMTGTGAMGETMVGLRLSPPPAATPQNAGSTASRQPAPANARDGFNGPGWYKIVFSPIGAAVFGGPYPNKSTCDRTIKDTDEKCAYYANQSSWDKDGISALR